MDRYVPWLYATFSRQSGVRPSAVPFTGSLRSLFRQSHFDWYWSLCIETRRQQALCTSEASGLRRTPKSASGDFGTILRLSAGDTLAPLRPLAHKRRGHFPLTGEEIGSFTVNVSLQSLFGITH